MASKGLSRKPVGVQRRLTKLLPALLLSTMLTGCGARAAGNVGGGSFVSPFSGILSFYRGPLDHLSAVRRGTCPMAPSCSEYAREAVARHGEIVGWIMASDRLMRCGRDEVRLAPRVRINGVWRYHDPVDRNDFWWTYQASKAGTIKARP